MLRLVATKMRCVQLNPSYPSQLDDWQNFQFLTFVLICAFQYWK